MGDGMRLTRAAYAALIEEEIAEVQASNLWSMTKAHVALVMRASIESEYGHEPHIPHVPDTAGEVDVMPGRVRT